MATTAIPIETAQNPTEATSTTTATTPAPAAVKAEQPASLPNSLLSDDTKAPEATTEVVKPPEGAPEKYTFAAPEGTTYDAQLIEAFSAAARAAGLTQDAAQQMIGTMAPALVTSQKAQIESLHQSWAEASRTDKEFGGDKYEENLGIARKAVSTFTTPAMRELLKATGFQHHPEFQRMLINVGRAISEDGYVGRSQGPPAVNMSDFNSIANALYPPPKG